jgi:hypothetical protein
MDNLLPSRAHHKRPPNNSINLKPHVIKPCRNPPCSRQSLPCAESANAGKVLKLQQSDVDALETSSGAQSGCFLPHRLRE